MEARLDLPLSAEQASDALAAALADGGLVAESQRAQDAAHGYLMRVGPAGWRPVGKRVRVLTLPLRRVGSGCAVALRWEATGPAGLLFPALDANLEVGPGDDPSGCRLSLLGCYEPPLGALGLVLDRRVLAKVGSETADALLAGVRDRLVRLAALGAATLRPTGPLREGGRTTGVGVAGAGPPQGRGDQGPPGDHSPRGGPPPAA